MSILGAMGELAQKVMDRRGTVDGLGFALSPANARRLIEELGPMVPTEAVGISSYRAVPIQVFGHLSDDEVYMMPLPDPTSLFCMWVER